MIIELYDQDDVDGHRPEFLEDFDTDRIASESPRRVGRAFRVLAETNEKLKRSISRRDKTVDDAGLFFDDCERGLLVWEREAATAWFEGALAAAK
jgi:hypothetical protein